MQFTRKVMPLRLWLFFILLSGWAFIWFQTHPAAADLAGDAESTSSGRVIVIADPRQPEQPIYQPPPAVFRRSISDSGIGSDLVATAVIQIRYLPSAQAWPVAARTAFEYARDIWATQVSSPVPIQVDAYWEDLSYYGDNVLGAAGPASMLRNFSGAPLGNTWYPVALANRLAGLDLQSSQADIEASFNSAFSGWYFGLDGNPGASYDFVSVALHELTHGLGLVDSFDVSGGLGSWGSSGSPYVYDRFVVNGFGQALIDTSLFPNNSSTLASQLTSGNVYFAGPESSSANAGAPVKLYAPYPYELGSSIAHLDEIYNNTVNALMTYSLSPYEAVHNPGPLVLALFADLGWGQTGGTVTETATATSTATSTPTATATTYFTPTPTRTPVPPFTPVAWVHLPGIMKGRAVTSQPTASPVATATYTPSPTPVTVPGSYRLFGKVTENGVPVGGVRLSLEIYDLAQSEAQTLAETLTDSAGSYQFLNVPKLAAGKGYFVHFSNVVDPGRLWQWNTRLLEDNPGQSDVWMGDFDIAEVELLSPADGAYVGLPAAFSWRPRPNNPYDSYELNIYAPLTYALWWFTDPPLGYSGSFLLYSLPADHWTGEPFQYDQLYWWDVWIYNPDGSYGVSYDAHPLIFQSWLVSGLAPQNSGEDSDFRRLEGPPRFKHRP